MLLLGKPRVRNICGEVWIALQWPDGISDLSIGQKGNVKRNLEKEKSAC